jgi:hypothetical protein
MSTTTNFKRIALVAVAALGMGLLSSAPSQAAIGANSIVLSTTAGTAVADQTTAHQQDSATGALVSVQFLSNAGANVDSVTLELAAKSKPSSSVSFPKALIQLVDTSSGSTGLTGVRLDTTSTAAGEQTSGRNAHQLLGATTRSTLTAAWGNNDSGTGAIINTAAGNKYAYAQFRVFLDTATTRTAGAYVYTAIVSPFENSQTATAASVKTIDVTITVGATTAAGVGSISYSYAAMVQASSWGDNIAAALNYVDSTVSVASTAGSTVRAVIRVGLRTSTGAATAQESVTVVMSRGSSGNVSGTAVGKNVTYAYTTAVKDTGYLELFIYSDGTAGDATIDISTPSVTFPQKKITFFSTTINKLTVVNGAPTLKVGSNTMTALAVGTVWVKATDSLGNNVVSPATGTGVFAYSSSTAIVSDTATSCTYNTTTTYYHCSLTGVAAGTATITIGNVSSGIGNATVTGDKTASVTVQSKGAATLSLAFDKATYAPGERGFIYISAKDADGKQVPQQTVTDLITSDGIVVTKGNITGAGGASLTLNGSTNTSPALSVRVASIDTCDTQATGVAVRCITFIAPAAGASIEITATGGAGLPAAGQVAVKATATVTDNGAAALAAVQALATTVASLRTLITTLTNLVLKIQKKVKA